MTQNFKAGEDVYRLVAVGETEDTSLSFAQLPFANGEKRLYYDLYATSVYYPDPDDPWDYETDYSDFSAKQEVLLTGYVGISEAEARHGITVEGNSITCPGEFEVYTPAGSAVARATGHADVAPGIYIVKSAGTTAKILVK